MLSKLSYEIVNGITKEDELTTNALPERIYTKDLILHDHSVFIVSAKRGNGEHLSENVYISFHNELS